MSRISAYLIEGTFDDSPPRLDDSPYFSLGSKIYGQGFIFDDDDPECTPIATRNDLLAQKPAYGERMPPYIGGDRTTFAVP